MSSGAHSRGVVPSGLQRVSPKTRLRDLAAQSARGLLSNSLPSDQRAQGCRAPAHPHTSVGASGPHDFDVRIGIARLARRRVHRIPCPTSVTFSRNAPLSGTG